MADVSIRSCGKAGSEEIETYAGLLLDHPEYTSPMQIVTQSRISVQHAKDPGDIGSVYQPDSGEIWSRSQPESGEVGSRSGGNTYYPEKFYFRSLTTQIPKTSNLDHFRLRGVP